MLRLRALAAGRSKTEKGGGVTPPSAKTRHFLVRNNILCAICTESVISAICARTIDYAMNYYVIV